MYELYTRFTETFKDFNERNPDYLFTCINALFNDETKTNSLIKSLKSLFNIYEIAGETEDEFKVFFEDCLNLHYPYYSELIKNYELKFDYTTATTRTFEDSGTQNINVDADNDDYDLPNRKVDDINGYKTAHNDNTETTTSSTNNTRTETYNDMYITMKNQYLRQLRDCYREFAEQFRDCFLHLYF